MSSKNPGGDDRDTVVRGGGGDASSSSRDWGVTETDPPRLPQFEELDPAGQEAFGLSYALLEYNLHRMGAGQLAEQAVANATEELVRPPPRLLEAQPEAILGANSFGRRLRLIADSFRESRHATQTADLASSIQLDSVSYAAFHRVLRDLFADGYSVEAFVTLFHFLGCLLTRCAAEHGAEAFRGMCRDLLRWFLAFLLRELLAFLTDYIRSLSAAQWRHFLAGFGAGAGTASLAFLVGLYVLWKK